MNAQRPHKQSMSELKLRRLVEHNQRLMEDLSRPRIKVSEASARCVVVCALAVADDVDVRACLCGGGVV